MCIFLKSEVISSCHMFLAILGPLPVVSYSYSGECWIKLLTEKTIQVNSVIIDEINGKFFIWSWAHAVVKHSETCCFKSRHPDLSCTDNKLKLTDNFNFNMFCITKGAHCALHNMYTCMCPAVARVSTFNLKSLFSIWHRLLSSATLPNSTFEPKSHHTVSGVASV